MLYLRLIILSVEVDVSIDNEMFLVTDFVNFKIKPAQFFGGAHRDSVCVRVFIGVSGHEYLFVLCFLKNNFH
jgi:hypothetical protein